MANCTECDKELTGRQRVCCSERCRHLKYRKSRKCERCGSPTRTDARFCSKQCGGVHRRKPPKPKIERQKKRQHWPQSKVRLPLCVVCGERFATPTTAMTCSAECREVKRLDDRRAEKQARRARQKDAFVARVYRRKVYERDGWTCQLCNAEVDRTARAPAPLAPTIDHIVPLARGGTHEPANVQTAHFICNSRKRDAA